MSYQQRKKMWYALTNNSETAYCKRCGIAVTRTKTKHKGKSMQGIIDCIKNNNNHTDHRKLQIICRGCNHRKNPRGPQKDTRTMTQAEKTNARNEPKFRAWIISQLAFNNGVHDYEDAITAGAEYVGCSTQATTTYLSKMTSSVGPLNRIQNEITWKDDADFNKFFGDSCEYFAQEQEEEEEQEYDISQ